MCRTLSINLDLRPCSIAIHGKFYYKFKVYYKVLLLVPFQNFSSLQIVQIWSINYELHFESVMITNIVYMRVYLALT